MYKPTTLRAYALCAEEHGYKPSTVFADSPISWDDIHQLKPMSLDTTAGLFDLLARRTAPSFAIQCGKACKLSSYGVVGFAVQSMPTVRDAFECWKQYCMLAGFPLIGSISEDGDCWTYEFTQRSIMSPAALRLCIETSIAAVETVVCELSGMPADTVQIDFSFPEPASIVAYAALGTDRIRFGQPRSRYIGKLADLDRPVRFNSDEVSNIFHENCDRMLRELLESRTIAERIEDVLTVSSGQIPTISEMAASLGTGTRTLQRQLNQEGLRYVEVVKAFRIRHAKLLLMESRSNVKSIAYLLGYQDPGSFRRAFKEWTGMTTKQWQAETTKPVKGYLGEQMGRALSV